MLGFLYRMIHEHAHPKIGNKHNMQRVEIRPGTHHKLLERSLFGLIRVWNRLPQATVDARGVTDFQKTLTQLVPTRCRVDFPDGEQTLCPRYLLTSAHETRFYDVVTYCM